MLILKCNQGSTGDYHFPSAKQASRANNNYVPKAGRGLIVKKKTKKGKVGKSNVSVAELLTLERPAEVLQSAKDVLQSRIRGEIEKQTKKDQGDKGKNDDVIAFTTANSGLNPFSISNYPSHLNSIQSMTHRNHQKLNLESIVSPSLADHNTAAR